VVEAKQLGLFSGAFDASPEHIQRKKAYSKYLEDNEAPMSLEAVPEQFRAYVYQDPLYGDFTLESPNRVSLVLDGLYDDKTVQGRSIAAGKERALTGQWQLEGAIYKLVLKEPGDDAYDGTFTVTLNPNSGVLKGRWQSLDGKADKSFALKRTTGKYNSKAAKEGYLVEIYGEVGDEVVKDPSVDLLQSKDVENLTRPQIRMLRNLIFARHGVSFENKQIRYVFEGMNWYVPKMLDTKVTLSDIETQNLAVLKRYESYAADTYNNFGR
jgi:hypothetical protein